MRDRRGLEEARTLNAVDFDKTGTLTLGEHRVVALRSAQGVDEAEALRLAAAVEADSGHPVARAILKSTRSAIFPSPPPPIFRLLPGTASAPWSMAGSCTSAGRRCCVNWVQNLWWAAGYNILAIPLAAGVLAGYGIVLAPAVAAIFMSASTVIVAINAQLLRRVSI